MNMEGSVSLGPVIGSVTFAGDVVVGSGVVVSEGGSVVDGCDDTGTLDVVLEPSTGGAVLEVDESTTVVLGAEVVVDWSVVDVAGWVVVDAGIVVDATLVLVVEVVVLLVVVVGHGTSFLIVL